MSIISKVLLPDDDNGMMLPQDGSMLSFTDQLTFYKRPTDAVMITIAVPDTVRFICSLLASEAKVRITQDQVETRKLLRTFYWLVYRDSTLLLLGNLYNAMPPSHTSRGKQNECWFRTIFSINYLSTIRLDGMGKLDWLFLYMPSAGNLECGNF